MIKVILARQTARAILQSKKALRRFEIISASEDKCIQKTIAALFAAALAYAPSNAAAYSSAAEALNDSHACWVMQRLVKVGPGKDYYHDIGGSAPGDNHRFDAFTKGTMEGENIALVSHNVEYRLVHVPCGQRTSKPEIPMVSASNVNPPILEIYKPGETKWLVGVFGTANWLQAVPAFGSDDLFRSNSLPLGHTAGGGFGGEGSMRPFYNNLSAGLSNFVVGVAGDVEFRGARVTQNGDFLGGSLQQTYRSPVLFEQFFGAGEEIHLTNQTIMIPNVRAGLVEEYYHYTTSTNFGGVVNYENTYGLMTGWAVGAGIDVKTQGWPGFQLLYLHREFGPNSVGLPTTNGARQTLYENELRFGLLFSVDHLIEFFHMSSQP
jgi:hypothetical protein